MSRFFIIFFPLIFGCSLVQRTGVRVTTDILDKSSSRLTEEYDWDFFKDAVPGNIKLIETLHYSDPTNKKLLKNLIKAYAGFAFNVNETMFLQDELSGKLSSVHKQKAISNYSKAMDYGLLYFKQLGLSWSDFSSVTAGEKLSELLNSKITESDYVATFYFAQSWASLINLQRDNIALVSLLPNVKIVMDHVCLRAPEIEFGNCDLFYAAYEAGRPVMLGGNPEKGRKIFLSAIKAQPLNLMYRIAYIQYYIIPMLDDIEYSKQRQFLINEFKEWDKVKNFAQYSDQKVKFRSKKVLNIFNATAQKRFEIIEKYSSDLF